MPYYHFQWTPEALEHLEEHDIDPEDYESIVREARVTGKSRSSKLPATLGYTSDGRFVFAVYKFIDETTIEPVTAYEVGD